MGLPAMAFLTVKSTDLTLTLSSLLAMTEPESSRLLLALFRPGVDGLLALFGPEYGAQYRVAEYGCHGNGRL